VGEGREEKGKGVRDSGGGGGRRGARGRSQVLPSHLGDDTRASPPFGQKKTIFLKTVKAFSLCHSCFSPYHALSLSAQASPEDADESDWDDGPADWD
jgi:hypothetical protein